MREGEGGREGGRESEGVSEGGKGREGGREGEGGREVGGGVGWEVGGNNECIRVRTDCTVAQRMGCHCPKLCLEDESISGHRMLLNRSSVKEHCSVSSTLLTIRLGLGCLHCLQHSFKIPAASHACRSRRTGGSEGDEVDN